MGWQVEPTIEHYEELLKVYRIQIIELQNTAIELAAKLEIAENKIKMFQSYL